MKAMIFNEYGSVDNLTLQDVKKPSPKENEVLIKVHAASINEWDNGLLKGEPFVNRLMLGLDKPKKFNILGSDIAGIIEAVGSKVSQFKVGDAVLGDLSACHWGGFAEYVTATEKALTLKPETMIFVQAAVFPQAGLLAWQGLCQGHIQHMYGKHVLINGASGGAGSFAIKIAKTFNAEVTGVCQTAKMDYVLSIGADHVIDYTQQDFTQNGQQYDLILDVMAHHPLSDYKASLKPNGRYVMLGGDSSLASKLLLLSPFISLFGSRKMGLLLLKANQDLEELIALFEKKKMTPVIDKIFPLKEGLEAFSYYAQGHAKGKVVITMQTFE